MRKSNFELLRILSMLFILCGHMMSQSGALSLESGDNLLIACMFGQGERIAVNVFLILGCWFMVSSSFKAERVARLYGQMFFYLIPISLLILLLGLPYEKVDLIRSLMPFLGRPVWFGSAYIALLLMSPFLISFYKSLSNSGRGKYCVIMLLIINVFCFITPKEMDNWVCSVSWFSVIFIYVAYYKEHSEILRWNKYFVLSLGLLLYCVLAFTKFLLIIKGMDSSGIAEIVEVYIKDLKSLFSLFISFCIFYFFQHTEIKSSKTINWFAGSAFSVYIMHQHPLLIRFLWNDIVMVPMWMTSDCFAVFLICSLLGLYLSITIIDKVRIKYVEPIFLNSSIVKIVCNRIDKLYNNI